MSSILQRLKSFNDQIHSVLPQKQQWSPFPEDYLDGDDVSNFGSSGKKTA